MCMLECTSIPAASGLMTFSAAVEAGTGTGIDAEATLGLVDFLRLAGFFGSWFRTTMDVSSGCGYWS